MLVLSQFVCAVVIIGQKFRSPLDHCTNHSIMSSQGFLCGNTSHASFGGEVFSSDIQHLPGMPEALVSNH